MSKEHVSLNGTSRAFLEEFAELKGDVKLLKELHAIEIKRLREELSSLRSMLKLFFGGLITLLAGLITVFGAATFGG